VQVPLVALACGEAPRPVPPVEEPVAREERARVSVVGQVVELAVIGEADRLGFANGLFRSRDAGASWEMAWDRPQVVNDLGWGFTHSLGIALSPTFASDGLLVVTTLPLVDEGDKINLSSYL